MTAAELARIRNHIRASTCPVWRARMREQLKFDPRKRMSDLAFKLLLVGRALRRIR